ncbi:hypothetical protein HJC23_003588 [Cyclotella cryptica]|uniref:Uncharacterized protein n=1 Tax=Cyclotella cryptica TaxID=29204 RepID=A0ABD3QIJ5_9STRA
MSARNEKVKMKQLVHSTLFDPSRRSISENLFRDLRQTSRASKSTGDSNASSDEDDKEDKMDKDDDDDGETKHNSYNEAPFPGDLLHYDMGTGLPFLPASFDCYGVALGQYCNCINRLVSLSSAARVGAYKAPEGLSGLEGALLNEDRAGVHVADKDPKRGRNNKLQ